MSDFLIADHWSKVDPKDWAWPNFSPAEIASRGDGSIRISRAFMDKLQALRVELNCPLILNSVYRDPAHNRKVGGAKDSYHMKGLAADVSMANHDPADFEAAARKVGFTGLGFYPPKKGNFIHVDIGPSRSWGKRWAAPRFDSETKDKTNKKVAGTVTLTALTAGAAEAVKPENLTELQQIVQPMISYAPIFQGVFAACGVGITAWFLWRKFYRSAP